MNSPETVLIALIVVGAFTLVAHRLLHPHVPESSNDPGLRTAWALEALAVVFILCELLVSRLPSVVVEIRAVVQSAGETSGGHSMPWDVLVYVVLTLGGSLGLIAIFRRLLKD